MDTPLGEPCWKDLWKLHSGLICLTFCLISVILPKKVSKTFWDGWFFATGWSGYQKYVIFFLVLRGRPLMIWGAGGGRIKNGFIFSAEMPFENFFPGEDLLRFSWGRSFEIHFFLEKGLRNFLDFLRAPPQIINGRPLIKAGILDLLEMDTLPST